MKKSWIVFDSQRFATTRVIRVTRGVTRLWKKHREYDLSRSRVYSSLFREWNACHIRGVYFIVESLLESLGSLESNTILNTAVHARGQKDVMLSRSKSQQGTKSAMSSNSKLYNSHTESLKNFWNLQIYLKSNIMHRLLKFLKSTMLNLWNQFIFHICFNGWYQIIFLISSITICKNQSIWWTFVLSLNKFIFVFSWM